MNQKDYYKILEVSPSASQEEIKDSYYRLVLESHPDKNPDDSESLNRFQEIRQAYDVLSNPIKKNEYDSLILKSNVFSGNKEFYKSPFPPKRENEREKQSPYTKEESSYTKGEGNSPPRNTSKPNAKLTKIVWILIGIFFLLGFIFLGI